MSVVVEPEVKEQGVVPPVRPKAVIIIPARMASKRLPGKPLLTAGGKSLVHWTYLQAMKTRCNRVVVATPDREIGEHCQENGIPWRPTRDDHPNGTSRCLEVVQQMKEDSKIELVLNWQVDEPLIEPRDANLLLCWYPSGLATLVYSVCYRMEDVHQTKVAYSYQKCHWFTRCPLTEAGSHIGIYAFSPALLEILCDLEITRFAGEEGLEQLTWVERGFQITPVEASFDARGINTEEDWEAFKVSKEKDL